MLFIQDFPKQQGHTFRASEPLDPNTPKSDGISALRSLFDGFDTVNKIFDPVVEEGSVNETETGTERQYGYWRSEDKTDNVEAGVKQGANEIADAGEDDNEDDKDETDKDIQSDERVQYAAQQPYPQTTSTEEEYTRARSYPRATNYESNPRAERTVTRRRMVVTGSGDGRQETRETHRTVQTHGTSGQYQPSESRRQTSQTNTYRSQPQRSQSVTYSYPLQTHRNTNTRYQTGSREAVRGPRYDGPVYVDSNGHYIDAQGRHLDSTGRYYDVSGRYADARVTHTVTYQSGVPNEGTRYYDVPRQQAGHYDTRRQSVSEGSSSSGVANQYVDGSQPRPVNSYGGTQFYSSGTSGTSFQSNFNPVTSQISSDPVSD